ncbi:coiled-coil domain-containing protein 71 isoform X3 [Falco rusticolus]|uniref:coiled-coil domain-containing protein 71 isoform X3 n=1 Tax=Falco rusticolus TaxID=120794 RepID=UPI000FFB6D79|nr:coiled-coil domain-containing protein 71 isoform X3 [Falco rusticolus]
MNIAVNNVEEKAVHSWSRISSAGQKVLEEALRVFNPMSKDLSDTETQLVAFIQGLKEEGYQPTILRSKDVYGYSSCTADIPSHTKESTPHNCAKASDSAKGPARNAAAVAEVSASLSSVSVNTLKVSAQPISKGNSTNLLLSSLKQTRSGTSKAAAVGFPTSMYPDVYPAMRLSVVLEALVPLKTAASCLESKYTQGHLGILPSDLKLLKASGPLRRFSSGKTTKITEEFSESPAKSIAGKSGAEQHSQTLPACVCECSHSSCSSPLGPSSLSCLGAGPFATAQGTRGTENSLFLLGAGCC